MTKGRIEAFSDGVFAVAITLLAFNLTVAHQRPGHLAAALAHNWPEDAAYVISFAVIGIIWMNHHAVLGLCRAVDRRVLVANLAVLLPVVTIPFATDLFATYLRSGSNGKVAAAVYSGVMFVMSVGFIALYRAVLHEESMVHASVDVGQARRNTLRFGAGLFVYLAAIGLSFASPVLVLIVHAVVAAFYLLDQVGVASATPQEAE